MSFRRRPESRRRPDESREPDQRLGPGFHREPWTPAFAGVTNLELLEVPFRASQGKFI
jgi:hypothetical protein